MFKIEPTDVGQLLDDLDAGAFQQKLGVVLSDVAAGVVEHHRVGKVQVTFTLKQLGTSNQVMIEHDLSYSAPTQNGERAEKNKTQTPVHVNCEGDLTLFPKNQNQLFDSSGKVTE